MAKSFIGGMLSNCCPRCGEGKVFRGLYRMNRDCPSCGTRFEREPGYFLGAMVFGYFFSALSTVPTFVIAIFAFEAPLMAVTSIAVGQVILLNPFVFRFGRLLWLHLDQRADPRAS